VTENRVECLPDHPFWDYSLRLYHRPGVSSACLALQDNHGVDVNLLLFCCWRGASAAPILQAAELQRLLAGTAVWSDRVIRPLRSLRRQLKNTIGSIPEQYSAWLRNRSQQIEIDAEHIYQLVLAQPDSASAGSGQPDAETAAASLCNYLAVIGVAADNPVKQHLQVLLAAAFPELEIAAICAILDD
jgi:uncharacterized protein (TIGR02444 family)